MTRDLHLLLVASIGDEPPVGAPHSAVRRRARQIRHRRQAVGAAAGAAGVAAVAVAAPRMTGARRTSVAPTPAPPAAAPTTRAPNEGELWPPTDRRCEVDYVPARPFTQEGPVQVVGKSPGIEARQEGREYAQIRPGDEVVLAAELQVRPGGVGFKRIILAIDRGKRYQPIDCDVAGIMAEDLAGRAVRVSMVVDVADVPPGLYKGVVLSLYDPGPPFTDRDVVGADADLGTLKFG